MDNSSKGQQGRELACYCNNVSIEKVKEMVSQGARTLSQLYDQSQAGVGPCGGSCRRFLKALLDEKQSDKFAAHVNIEQTVENVPLGVYKAISLFNRRYYWETHEVLEELWLDVGGDTKTFYQALIQSAAAMYHVLNANPQGVIKLSQGALKKFSIFGNEYMGMPLDDLKEKLSSFHDQAKEILGHTRSGFDYNLLPVLVIGPEMDVPVFIDNNTKSDQ